MKKGIRIFVISVLVLILIPLLFFFGLKIWINQQYNKDGNLLLVAYPDPSILYEITKSKIVVWEYDLSEVMSSRRVIEMIYATRFKNGNTLIVDPETNAVYEVNRSKEIVWRCDELNKDDTLVSHLRDPASAQRLPNGNTLIADSYNSRVIEVTGDCRIIWEYICVQNDSFAYPARALKFPDNNIGILVFGHSGLEYWEIEYSSNQAVKKIDLAKYTTPSAVILANKHILVALPFTGAGAIELDTLTNMVWRFEPEEDIFDLRKNRWGNEIKPVVRDVYPKGKRNLFIHTNYGTIEITPSKEVVWKLADDEGLKDILGIKFFEKGLNDSLSRMYHLAGIVEN